MNAALDLLNPAAAPTAGPAAAPVDPSAASPDTNGGFGRALADVRRPAPARAAGAGDRTPAGTGPDSAQERAPAADTTDAAADTGAAATAHDARADADAPAATAPPRRPGRRAAGEAGEDEARAQAAAETLAALGLIPPPPPPVEAAAQIAAPKAGAADAVAAAADAVAAGAATAAAAAGAAVSPQAELQPAAVPVGIGGTAQPPFAGMVQPAAASAAPAVATDADADALAAITTAPLIQEATNAPPSAVPPATFAATTVAEGQTDAAGLAALAAAAGGVVPPPVRSLPPAPADTASAVAAEAEAAVAEVPTAGYGAQLRAQALREVVSGTGDAAVPAASDTTETGAGTGQPLPGTPGMAPVAATAPVAPDTALRPAEARNGGAAPVAADPTPAPQTPLPVANPRAWAPLLGQHLMHLVQTGETKATVRVNPPQLGPVEMRLELKDAIANVSFYAHDAQVREALEQSQPRLRELLGAQGVQLDQSHVGDQAPRQSSSDGGAYAGSGDPREQNGSSLRPRHAWSAAGEEEGGGNVLPVRALLGGVDHYV